MRLMTWGLFVALLALLGINTVLEATRKTEMEYELARNIQREESLTLRLNRLQYEVAVLTSPWSLEQKARQMNLRPLQPLAQQTQPPRHGERRE